VRILPNNTPVALIHRSNNTNVVSAMAALSRKTELPHPSGNWRLVYPIFSKLLFRTLDVPLLQRRHFGQLNSARKKPSIHINLTKWNTSHEYYEKLFFLANTCIKCKYTCNCRRMMFTNVSVNIHIMYIYFLTLIR
jgi:hypothetical protein